MGDVDEGDAQLLLHGLQLQLHLLAQLQVQRAQGLVQQQDLRLVHQRPGDGDALLLSAGQRVDGALLVALHLHQLQHPVHPAPDLFLLLPVRVHAQLLRRLQVQAKGDVVKHVQMIEQRVLLEHRVDAALVGGDARHVLPLEQDFTLAGHFKSADDAQQRGLATARGPQQRDEFTFADVEVHVVQHLGVAEALADPLQFDEAHVLDHG